MSLEKWRRFCPSYKYIQRNENLPKILEFYLWNCPVEGVVPHAKTFKMYGFSEPYQYKKLKTELLNNQNKKIDFVVSTREMMLETLQKEKQYDSKHFNEIIILLKDASGINDLYRCIRNAFAHGTFYMEKIRDINDFYFFLESLSGNFNINARIVLKSSTLMRWIKIVGYKG